MARDVTRDELLSEYDRLSRLMLRAGLDPIVSSAVVDVFSDGELRALIKDSARRLIVVRRFEIE